MNYQKLLLDKINKSIRENEEKIAYKAGEKAVTYRELDILSNNIALYIDSTLSEESKKKEEPVRIGIMLPRNTDFVACILAVAKLGCSYVPIDTATPSERVAFIKEDSKMDFLINTGNLSEIYAFQSSSTKVPSYHKEFSEAYLIYTSGTTGRPKGVSQTYRTIYNYMLRATQPDDFNVSVNSIVLQFASINFDVSVMEIFVALFTGATMVIAQDAQKRDSSKLYELLIQEKVSFCYLPPSFLITFPDFNFPEMDTLSAGGEAVPYNLTKRIAGKYPYRFVNGYGPTESFYATTHVIRNEDDWKCIGKPVPGVVGYVVDENMNRVSPGESGELLLGGNQLANGYINLPELTEKAFVKNPFIESQEVAPVLYHTGDHVVLNADGSYDYIGRFDSQIKFHGYRIELSEIVSVIERNKRVTRAFAIVETIGKAQHLVVYFSTEDGCEDYADILEDAKTFLPPYMIPSFWIFVEKFELNINGKIDKSKLVNKAIDRLTENVQEITNEQSVFMRETARIMGLDSINIDIDLFDELGLSSIEAMQIPVNLSALGMYYSVEDIYTNRTIRNIVANHKNRKAYWYNDPEGNTEKPVIVVVSGYSSFNFLYTKWAEELKDEFSIFVLESYLTFIGFKVYDMDALIGMYVEELKEIVDKYNIVAFTGFCMGGDQAMYLAHTLYKDNPQKPTVVTFEGDPRRDPYKEHTILLEWDLYTKEQNDILMDASMNLIATMPHFHYDGRVIVTLCDTFEGQQSFVEGVHPVLTEENIKWARIFFDRTPALWKEDYPDCTLVTIPGHHDNFIRTEESVRQVADIFLELKKV